MEGAKAKDKIAPLIYTFIGLYIAVLLAGGAVFAMAGGIAVGSPSITLTLRGLLLDVPLFILYIRGALAGLFAAERPCAASLQAAEWRLL